MMEKLKNFYGAHPIRWTILLLVIVIAAAALGYYAPSFKLQAAEVSSPEVPVTEKGDVIPVGGVVTVAQKDGRTLTLDTEEMVLTVRDDATGHTWSSAVKNNNQGDYKALLRITYLGEDNNLSEWNSYDNCVAFGDFQYYTIDGGVRIELNINEGESSTFFEYLPQRIPTERYEGFFMEKLEELKADGEMDENTVSRYERALGMVYRKNNADNCYALTTTGVPSVSVTAQLIALCNAIGYTRDMLIEDCAVFGVVPDFHEPAQFDIAIEATLDGGDLVIRMPGDQIVSGNDFYQLQRVAMLPNFGAVASDEGIDGYFLTPDGAGALMKFNSYTATVPEYVRAYLDNDYYTDYYYMSEYAEELLTPVYGILYGGDEPTHGMLAILEHGAETANLHVSLAGVNGTGMNRAFVSFDTLEYARVKIYGAYSDNGATYLSDSGHIVDNYTIRYRPFGEPVTYFDLAMSYRDYLAAASGKEVKASEGPGAYLEVLGAVTIKDRLLGVPYDRTATMSAYSEVEAMLGELPSEGVTIQYDGVFNGGAINALNDGARLVKENGAESELKSLQSAAKAKGVNLFYQVNLSRVYKNGRTYRPNAHGLRDFSNEAAYIYPYSPAAQGIFNGHWDPIHAYTRLSPRYLPYVTARFLEDSGDFPALAIGDLARDVYADYRYRQVIDPVEARLLVADTLNTLSQRTLSMHDPATDLAVIGDYAVDVSRASSNYTSFYATVPFRQLALSGLVEVAGEDVNLNSRSLSYYLLQAAELGTSVKYTVTARNADVLKNSHFEYLYAVSWDQWKDEIIKACEALAELRGEIGGQTIVGHRMLGEDVFETTWSGGTRSIVNYSSVPYESEAGMVEAGSYLLVREGGAL